MMSSTKIVKIIEASPTKKHRDIYARADALGEWIQEDKSRFNIPEVQFEYFALAVMGNEHNREKDEGWPGYFQPSMRMQGKENPGYGLATPDALVYWERRSENCEIPQLRARYADLVIDFSQRLSDKGAHNDIRKRYITGVLEIATDTTKNNWHETQTLLRRALYHAKKLKDTTIWKSLAEAIIHVDQIMEIDQGHLPSFSLKLLSDKNIELDAADQETILQKFESALEPPKEGEKPDFWKAHSALKYLVEFYKANEHRAKRIELIGKLEAYTEQYEDKNSGMRADSQWEIVQDAYSYEGDGAGINRALAHRKRIEPLAAADLNPIRFEFKIEKEKFEKIIDVLCKGEPPEQLVRFCDYHALPHPAFESFRDAKRKNLTLIDVATNIKMDEKGRPVTKSIGSELDDETKMIEDIAEFIRLDPITISMHLDRLRKEEWFNANTVISFLFGNKLIERDDLLIEAIQFFFQDVHSAFLHIAIPRIERLIRDECERLGAPTTRQNKTGGIDHRLLNELLQRDELKTTFDQQFLLYLRTLLTEKHGLNFRNDLLHGITSSASTSKSLAQISRRVFQSLCAIALHLQVARDKTINSDTRSKEE